MWHACMYTQQGLRIGYLLKYTVAIHNDYQGLLSYNGQYTSR